MTTPSPPAGTNFTRARRLVVPPSLVHRPAIDPAHQRLPKPRDDLDPGAETHTVEATRAGVVTHVDNEVVSGVARRTGAPRDAGAGVRLERAVGDHVEVGDPLFTLHAEHADKLAEATAHIDASEPVRVRLPGESVVEHL